MSDFCTQLDQLGSGHDRCAAAALASCLLTAGWQSDPWGLTLQIADAEGWTDKGTTIWELQQVAQDKYGLSCRTWVNWPEAVDAIAAGEWPLALLDNWHLRPTGYPDSPGWHAEHWIRLRDIVDGGEMVYAYDPLCYLPQPAGVAYQGPLVYTTYSVRTAIGAAPYREAGVILSKSP